MRTLLTTIGVLALSICVADWSRASIQIYSNNPSPGDNFTNTGGLGATLNVGATGWRYRNVRTNGHVGINDEFKRSGSGSVYLSTSGAPNSKADIELGNLPLTFGSIVLSPASPALGKLGDLTTLNYEWYRDSSSGAAAHFHPVLRLMLVNPDNPSQNGYIVFEQVYNGTVTAALDQWVLNDITGSSRLWSTGSLPYGGEYYTNNVTLDNWRSAYGDLDIVGISAGVGSGWGALSGAIDNITIGFTGGQATTYNFEVQGSGVVPEPATILVWSGIAACAGLAYLRKKQTA